MKSLIRNAVVVGVLIGSVLLVLLVGLQIMALLFPGLFSGVLPESMLTPSRERFTPDADDFSLRSLPFWGVGMQSLAAFILFSALAVVAYRLGKREARPPQDQADED